MVACLCRLVGWVVALPVAVLLLALSLSLSLACAALSAPLPRGKVRQPLPPLTGVWRILWGRTPYTALLSPCGRWGACAGESRYEGTWTRKGDTLTISEHIVRDDGTTGSSSTYTFRVAGLVARTEHGLELRFIRRLGD